MAQRISHADRRATKPLVVTREQLDVLLSRYTLGWRWAEDAIGELWRNATPIPQPRGMIERRMVLPSQLRVWVQDVGKRGGFDLSLMRMRPTVRLPK